LASISIKKKSNKDLSSYFFTKGNKRSSNRNLS